MKPCFPFNCRSVKMVSRVKEVLKITHSVIQILKKPTDDTSVSSDGNISILDYHYEAFPQQDEKNIAYL